LVVLGLAGIGLSAFAGYETKVGDATVKIGFDVRLRLEGWDRNTVSPDWGLTPGANQGPAVEYLRVRERLWTTVDFTPDLILNARLVNRWQHFSSHFNEANNVGGGGTWRAPDELVFDLLNLDIKNIADSGISLKLGRQELMLGNGMVLLEGTPYDQGRTTYFDGAVATYTDDCNTIKVFALYNEYKDPIAINLDEKLERRLRRADTLVLGFDGTYNYSASLNGEAYYIFVDFDDDADTAERNHPVDENAELHIVGARLFGSPHEQIDYSFELAQQWGECAGSADFTGMMGDARVTLKAPKGTALSPSLMLEYTMFTGDDPASGDEVEGWHSAFSEYPIWREELMPILTNGNWTNLNQARAALNLVLHDSESVAVKLQGVYAYLFMDEGQVGMPPGGGGGDEMGHLYSGFLDVVFKKANLSFALEYAHLEPGNYWLDGAPGEWGRAQMIWTY